VPASLSTPLGTVEVGQNLREEASDSANVFVTSTALGINRSVRVIARAQDPSSGAKLTRSGADHVVLPAAIGADRIANLIIRPSAEELLRGGDRRSMDLAEPLPASSPLVGKPIEAIEDRRQSRFSHRGPGCTPTARWPSIPATRRAYARVTRSS
jgi:hypothetical protein